ncbi:sn-glycerol-3-phosphate ABC transporter ATP-binding protein UgpC [Ideonella azotifigens]|uniref:Sn-glycerol-3-phosphate ABC transporter ATP-binding protein UgpC n=1 Tax=Ideonella azotifigens TaxID=513160 RepID=A0ABN1JLM7_9BURK|nr:sn-glycerol-3-phosphate ABC transporter ATP-binding protein UgpC [Ideonella azotifigens]MCD2341853.1 sn-glycerol-3-phosphate ABC transporter ATP-binding protein UgpC [Ideonella azotifigens]
MSRIELRNVSKRFGPVSIFHAIDLSIAPGEFVVFIGPSGCGKSTLLRLIAGLEDASDGEIEIDGRIVNALPPAKRDVAMVFQSYALYPHMSVYQNMAFGLQQQKLPKAEVEARVKEASRILQLDELLDRKPKQLSGGQRQRVAIGRAIVRKPKVFLFDEPLSNLDAALRVNTRVEIAKLHRQIGSASMIYVTHDQVEAMTLADKIVLLTPGAGARGEPGIAQVGSPLTLYHHPANRFVAGFIGSPAMNFVDASVAAADAERVLLDCAGQSQLACVDGQSGGRALQPGQRATLGIRPEHLLAQREAPGQDTGWPAQVQHVEHLGEHGYVHAKLRDGNATLIAKVHDENFRVGDMLRLVAPPESVHVFREDGTALARRLVVGAASV